LVTAATWNLTIEQGATFYMPVQLSTGGPVAEGGTPVNLTGCEIRLMVRKRLADASPVLSLTTVASAGITITGPTTGQFVIQIAEVTTAALPWVSGVYDLEVETSGGFVRRYLQGKVKVSKEVTR
jgi:hypothetical protein